MKTSPSAIGTKWCVNLKGVYTVVHDTVPRMISQHSGRIIAVSSVAGQRDTPLDSHCSATKGGVISFTKELAGELAWHDILVNSVAPAFVDTHIFKHSLRDKSQRKRRLGPYPLKRMGKPEEVAGPILFAVSDLATFITGEVINVNGGSFLCG